MTLGQSFSTRSSSFSIAAASGVVSGVAVLALVDGGLGGLVQPNCEIVNAAASETIATDGNLFMSQHSFKRKPLLSCEKSTTFLFQLWVLSQRPRRPLLALTRDRSYSRLMGTGNPN